MPDIGATANQPIASAATKAAQAQAAAKATQQNAIAQDVYKTGNINNVYAYEVGASDYGGPSDPSTPGTTGSCGESLVGTMAFAELGMGINLGHLACGTQLLIGYNGKSVLATKMDIGLGGAPVAGHVRCIDLWYQTAAALGFSGVGVVTVMRPDGKPIPGILGTRAKGTVKGPSGIVGTLDSSIGDIGDAIDSVPKFLSYITSIHFAKLALGVIIGVIGLVEIGHVVTH